MTNKQFTIKISPLYNIFFKRLADVAFILRKTEGKKTPKIVPLLCFPTWLRYSFLSHIYYLSLFSSFHAKYVITLYYIFLTFPTCLYDNTPYSRYQTWFILLTFSMQPWRQVRTILCTTNDCLKKQRQKNCLLTHISIWFHYLLERFSIFYYNSSCFLREFVCDSYGNTKQ